MGDGMSDTEVAFDPAKFMSDEPIGRLAQRCLDNAKVILPDGTYIERTDGGFNIVNRNGKELAKYTGVDLEVARGAATAVLNASAKSRHPQSVGGRRVYASFEKLKQNKPLEGVRRG
jgi:hypothetical protein